MDFVVCPPVAEIDPADERDVVCRAIRPVDEDDLLVVRAEPADPLVEQHLAAAPFTTWATCMASCSLNPERSGCERHTSARTRAPLSSAWHSTDPSSVPSPASR
jgi:hypothetical protein